MSEDIKEPNREQPQLTDLSGNSALFICHEIRTPLTSIKGALGLLHTGQLGSLSHEGQQLLAIAINNVNRLSRLAQTLEDKPTLPMTILSRTMVDQLQLENNLYKALTHQEFELAYQPIVSMKNNHIIGFEALARWPQSDTTSIPASVFIPLAEKLGCIHKLGIWILEQACHQLHIWQQAYANQTPLSMSVNLSVAEIFQPDLIPEVQRILETTKILPNTLKIEITESTLINNNRTAIPVLLALQDMGIQLYIDDFGTGYSCLSRLQELPIDGLKIDRSFVQSQQWQISKTICLLARNLGLDVIVEGVETPEELTALQRAGCTKMQGYYFSKPLDSQSVTALLSPQSSKVPVAY
ncbi:putative bifunctional diguanylate cyclase/phosphodiesterase [Leptolyngbya sp. PCC 6406]|uniref:putative bifunctional diguanylate cyclase/phosphodiesterase n=1 Tax=Leptolyngbya sp. PCC 6406 TaxID=1173264 RepID=UPI0002AC039B|nr:EAL domain-containing protein [Leptolyngbya sp. PCC 6406]